MVDWIDRLSIFVCLISLFACLFVCYAAVTEAGDDAPARTAGKVQSWFRDRMARRKLRKQVMLSFEKVQHPDGSGRVFYHNVVSNVCTWGKPRFFEGDDLTVVPWANSLARETAALPHGACRWTCVSGRRSW